MINITFSGEAVNVIAEMRTLLAGGMPMPSMERTSEAGPAPAEIVQPTKAPRGRPRTKRPDIDQPVTDIDENGDPVAEQANEPEILTSKEPEPEAAPAVKDDDVRNAVREYIKAKGENATFELLKSFGVKNATTAIEAGKGPALVAKVREELAEDAAA